MTSIATPGLPATATVDERFKLPENFDSGRGLTEEMLDKVVISCNMPSHSLATNDFYPHLARVSRFSVRKTNEINSAFSALFRARLDLYPWMLARMRELSHELQEKGSRFYTDFTERYARLCEIIERNWSSPSMFPEIKTEAQMIKAVERLRAAMDKLEAALRPDPEPPKRQRAKKRQPIRSEPYTE
jgi:hypothetical protein